VPVYVYRCFACGHEWEDWQKMDAPPIRFCPVCKRPYATRKPTAALVQLKGDGWAKDGYAGNGGR
jgi:putative FmdB family regulatory protein